MTQDDKDQAAIGPEGAFRFGRGVTEEPEAEGHGMRSGRGGATEDAPAPEGGATGRNGRGATGDDERGPDEGLQGSRS